MSDKKYISGSARAVQTQHWEIVNLSLKLSDMQSIVNDKWYVNMSIMKRKEVGQYGDTHYVVENDYKPKAKQEEAMQVAGFTEKSRTELDDVPF